MDSSGASPSSTRRQSRRHLHRHRTYAQARDPQRGDVSDMREQIDRPPGLGLGLDAIQCEEKLAFLRLQREAIGVLTADKTALVFRPAMRPGRKTTRRPGQRQTSAGEQLRLRHGPDPELGAFRQ